MSSDETNPSSSLVSPELWPQLDFFFFFLGRKCWWCLAWLNFLNSSSLPTPRGKRSSAGCPPVSLQLKINLSCLQLWFTFFFLPFSLFLFTPVQNPLWKHKCIWKQLMDSSQDYALMFSEGTRTLCLSNCCLLPLALAFILLMCFRHWQSCHPWAILKEALIKTLVLYWHSVVISLSL